MVAFSVETPSLAAALPAEADGLDVHVEHTRFELEAAGAQLADESEGRAQLGPWRSLTGRPFVSIAFVPNRPVPIAASRLRRSLDVLRTLFEVPRARKHLARLGYRHLRTLRWHTGHAVDIRKPDRPLRRVSTRAYVIGSLTEDYATVLDRSLELAGQAIGAELHPEKIVPADSLVAICDQAVLRLSLRPAKRLCLGYAGLGSLQERSAEPLRRLLPRPLAQGEFGAYLWSLEERMPGVSARAPLSPALSEQAFDFLTLLAEAGEQTRSAIGLVDEAGLLGSVTDADLGLRLEEAALSLEETLATLPRVVGHSDLWAGNLLVEGDQLRGVVDWDGWYASELPMMDYLHLHLLHKRSLTWGKWGPSLLAELLPFARAGGDERAVTYCRKLGIEPDPELLEQLVWAYWIRRAARLTEYYEWRNDKHCLDGSIRKIAAVFLDHMAGRTTSSAAGSGSEH